MAMPPTIPRVWSESWQPARTDALLENPRALLGVPFASGRPLGPRFPLGWPLTIRSRTLPADFFMAGPAFIVSARLKGVLQGFGVLGEFFALTTSLLHGGEPSQDYYFLNIIDLVDCLDWDRSEFEHRAAFAIDIRRLVLVPAKARGHVLFRVLGTLPSVVCIDSSAATEIERCGITGVDFVEPSKWKNPLVLPEDRKPDG